MNKQKKETIIDAEIVDDDAEKLPNAGERARLGRDLAESAAGILDTAARVASLFDVDAGKKVDGAAQNVRAFGQAAEQTVAVAKTTATTVTHVVEDVERRAGAFKEAFKKLDKAMTIPRSGSMRRR